MSLQKVVDEHVQDTQIPRYTVTLSNHPGGDVTLPANVRLFLDACGDVTVKSTGGNNALSYTNGRGRLTIESATDCELNISRVDKCVVMAATNCRVRADRVVADLFNFTDCILQAVSVEAVVAVYTRCNVNQDVSQFESLTLAECRGQLTECKVTDLTRITTGSDLLLSNTEHKVLEVDASAATFVNGLEVTDSARVSNESSLSVAEGDIKLLEMFNSGYDVTNLTVQEDMTVEGCSGVLQSSTVNGLTTLSGGRMTSSEFTAVDVVEATDLAWTAKSCNLESDLVVSGVVGGWADVTVVGNVVADGCTLKATRLSVEGDTTLTGGATPELKSCTFTGVFDATGLVGRNKALKCTFASDVTAQGNGDSKLEVSECTVAGNLTTGSLSALRLNSVLCAGEAAVSAVEALEMSALVAASATLDAVTGQADGITAPTVSVSSSKISLRSVAGILDVSDSAFSAEGVTGAVSANRCAGVVRGAPSVSCENSSLSLIDVASWAPNNGLCVGVDSNGPHIQAAPTLLIDAPESITIQAGQINLIGNVTHSGGNYVKSGGTMSHDGINVGKTHLHGGVTNGSSFTLIPTPLPE